MTSLMPWARFGMVLGGNAGLAPFGALDRRCAQSVSHLIGFYGVCNAGMLLGMAIAEHGVTRFALGLEQEVAAALTVVAMLAGMTAGMGARLSWRRAFPRSAASSVHDESRCGCHDSRSTVSGLWFATRRVPK